MSGARVVAFVGLGTAILVGIANSELGSTDGPVQEGSSSSPRAQEVASRAFRRESGASTDGPLSLDEERAAVELRRQAVEKARENLETVRSESPGGRKEERARRRLEVAKQALSLREARVRAMVNREG